MDRETSITIKCQITTLTQGDRMKYLTPDLMTFVAEENYQISEHFNSEEFEDGFSIHVLVDLRLINILERMRLKTGPLKITSGYRSESKQAQLKSKGYHTAKGISTHMVGAAVDIKALNLTGLELEVIARDSGIKAVGVGKNWIHIDLRSDKTRRWEY